MHIRKGPSQYWDVGVGDEFHQEPGNSCLTLDDDEEIILGIEEDMEEKTQQPLCENDVGMSSSHMRGKEEGTQFEQIFDSDDDF